jgi:hypothetical protein
MTSRTSPVNVSASGTNRLPGWWWMGPVVVGGLLISGAPAILGLVGAIALAALWCRDLDEPRRN